MSRSLLLVFGLLAGLGFTTPATAATLTISASAAGVPPGGLVALAANGGDEARYRWSIPGNNSGATISADGLYKAGSVGGVTDTVRVDDLTSSGQIIIVVGPTLAIATPAPVPPRGSSTLVASGGSGQVSSWRITANSSGGSISSAGVYTAGPNGGVSDIVQATDSLGNTREVAVPVGPSLAIEPPTLSVAPRSTLQLAATGGSATGEEWTLDSNPSGGRMTTAGVYTAGSNGNVDDVVKVTDSLGNTATLTLRIGRGLVIRTTSVDVAPRATTLLTPSGGSGVGYRFSMTENNSGGFITADGAYTAGPTADARDTVVVVDSLSNRATVLLHVTVGVSIAVPSQPLIPGEIVTLAASGGTGTGFAWSPVSLPSGGTVTLAGRYTPGRNGNTSDTISVVDSVGNSASISIRVGSGLVITLSGNVAPRQAATLTASGGSDLGFQWTFHARGSAGTLSPVEGGLPIPPMPDGGNDNPVLSGPSVVYTAGPYDSVIDTVQVTDSFNNVGTLDIMVGPGIQISPAKQDPQGHNTFETTPGRQQRFSASGGSGEGYVWSIPSTASKATVTEDGLFKADPDQTELKETLLVRDSLGNRATVIVTILGDIPVTGTPATPAPSTGCASLGSTGFALTGLLLVLSFAMRRRLATLRG